ncbi:unnamed protein product [Macrosiphum euphorbiae]|uniref:Uncharacterized protein n=1 Tax=Macrosiphum euphorbiae TaxID=13131 RepID=A0AAV0XXL8_9HEMI|nr:unnamed protein product [Macrosiphum euphorbiae]
MLYGFQIIVNYVNQQPVIREHLQGFLFGYIHDFWFRQITAENIIRAEVTCTIRDYVGTLDQNEDLAMFLRRAGHLMDAYYRRQVRPQPLITYD